jgi:hypothetical protein
MARRAHPFDTREEKGPAARRAPPRRGAEPFTIAPADEGDGNYQGGGPGTLAAPVRRGGRGLELDVHELLKREAFGSSGGSCDDHFEKSRPCPTDTYGISDQYLTLDSFSKLRSSNVENGEFQWNFMVQGVTGDEVLGVRDRIDTIIEIQLGAFAMPILPEVPYILADPPAVPPSGTNQLVLVQNNDNSGAAGSNGAPALVPSAQYPKEILLAGDTTAYPWVHNPYSQTPYYGHLAIQIREAGLQSYSDRNGARHHFEFALEYPVGAEGRNPTMLLAAPFVGQKWDTFIFTDPLKDMHGLTLVFRNPDVPIRFQPDCLYDVVFTSDGNPGPLGPFLMGTFANHGLDMGDRIFIEGFSSGNATLDTYMNRPAGHVVSGDPPQPAIPAGTPLAVALAPGPYPDTFWLDPAVSLIDLTVPPPRLPALATVCVAKRRLRIPIRLRRVVPRLTQYIKPR